MTISIFSFNNKMLIYCIFIFFTLDAIAVAKTTFAPLPLRTFVSDNHTLLRDKTFPAYLASPEDNKGINIYFVNDKKGLYIIRLIDIKGKLQQSLKLPISTDNETKNIQIKNIQAGIYHINIIFENKNLLTQTIKVK